MKNLIGLLLSTLATATVWATTCYTDCEARFPKWYQAPDRKRCQAEKALACLDPSELPGPRPLPGFSAREAELRARLVGKFLDRGYVVSREADGSPEHQGDSLLWSSLAMGILPCDQGAETTRAIIDSVNRNDGRLVRIDPLPGSYAGNETSRDQVTGALLGFVLRDQRCPQDREALRSAWRRHHDFVIRHDGRLHEGGNPNFYMNPAMRFLWDLVSTHFGAGEEPGSVAKAAFESGVIISSTATDLQESACYPVHLSTLMMITAARLGRPVSHLTRREFCHQTRGMELPLTEWFCDRGSPESYLASFEPNQWEYRHQRCKWESPDGSPGKETPALDFLMMKFAVENL